MHTTLTRVALALALSLPMSAALADPPAVGDPLVLVPGHRVCRDRDAMVELAITPSGDGWTDLWNEHGAAGVCGVVTGPTLMVVGVSIDAGVDAVNGWHWWAVEVTSTAGTILWLLYGEETPAAYLEPSGWRI